MKRFLVFVFTLVVLFGWQAEATLGPGCDPTREAVAFHSIGTGDGDYSIISPAPEVVRPCSTMTGFGGAESRVAVAPNGDVLQTPAIVGWGLLGTPVPAGHLPGAPRWEMVTQSNSGIGWSTDVGDTWTVIFANGTRCPQGDNDLYIDRMTGRLFYSCIFAPLPPPANQFNSLYAPVATLLSSPADPPGYIRWNQNYLAGHDAENPRFTSAPAPVGYPQPVPGENMSYWCGNAPGAAPARICYRSFDGGESWEFASFSHLTVPQHDECGANTETGGYAQGDQTDGSLWLTLSCGGNNYLARSTDEAATWPIVGTLPAAGTLRVDSAGNLYLYSAGLILRTSTDEGQNWSDPISLVAPAARGKALQHMGLPNGGLEPGQAGVAYYVSRAPEPGFDGYITVTKNALLGSGATLYAAAVPPNDPNQTDPRDPAQAPLMTSSSLSEDFIHMDISPNGTPWGAFYSDCHKDSNGNWIENYCNQTDGTRTLWGAPVGETHNMTMGSLQWP